MPPNNTHPSGDNDLAALPAPDVSLPTSPHTVRVRVIDNESRMVCQSSAFIEPVLRGQEKLRFTTVCFLIEHLSPDGEAQHVLFDCGERTDYWNLPPHTKSGMTHVVAGLQVDRGVDEILTAQGFDLAKLDAMIWSHWHWDHIGDGAKYPHSTDIVVGPGFTDNFVPGWPTDPNGLIPESSMQGHRMREPDFPLEVGGFRAHDYFGDGSFYLLDVPGHTIGHICGFARTTPDTFIFMGADCLHFAGVIRPTAHLPLPGMIPTSAGLDPARFPHPCPCSAFSTLHRHYRAGADAAAAAETAQSRPSSSSSSESWRRVPFFDICSSSESIYEHHELAQASADKIKRLDAQDNVLVCLAHDPSVVRVLPLFNDDAAATANDWRARGHKAGMHWGFLNELPRPDGTPGPEPWAEGLWHGGKRRDWMDGSVLEG